MRVAVAGILLLDLATRLPHLRSLHTDAGALPRSALPASLALELAPHAWSGAVAWQAGLFALAAAAAVLLGIGRLSRTAAAASFLLLLSLHVRNPLVLNSGDVLLVRLLGWMVLLPIGAAWSLDARRTAAAAQTNRATPHVHAAAARDAGSRRSVVAGPATAAILLQVVLVYAFNAGHKLAGGAWWHGDALGLVLANPVLATALGAWLGGGPTSFLGRLWLLLLCASPLLVLSTGRFRLLLAAAFAAAHVTMGATLRLGVFPLVSLSALLLFLPPGAWDRAQRVHGALPGLPMRLRPLSARQPGNARGGGSRSLPPWRTPARHHPVEPRRQGLARLRPSGALARLGRAGAYLLLAALLLHAAAAAGLAPAPDPLQDQLERSGAPWAMFARPATSATWIAVSAVSAGGAEADAFTGAPADLQRPQDLDAGLGMRWRKYLGHVAARPELAVPLAAYACTLERPGGPPEQVRLHAVEQPLAPHAPSGPPKATLLLAHGCTPSPLVGA